VADHHPALTPVALGVIGDQRDLPQAQFTFVMQVNVDPTVEFAGQLEHEVELGEGVVIDTARVEPTDVFHAQRHGFAHQFGGAGAADQAGLREHHQLQVDQVTVAFAQLLHGFYMTQAEIRVDVDVAAHGQRPTGNAVFQKRTGAFGDGALDFAQYPAFVGDVILERRPGAVRVPGLTPEGFVEMNVAFDQGRGEELVLAVNIGGGQRCAGGWTPLLKQAVLQKQVLGSKAVGPHVAQPAGLVHGKPLGFLGCLTGPLRGLACEGGPLVLDQPLSLDQIRSCNSRALLLHSFSGRRREANSSGMLMASITRHLASIRFSL